MVVKVFADTNIIIDLIENRDFDRASISSLFLLAEQAEIEIFISESVITNALYITNLPEQINLVLKIVHTCCFKIESFQKGLTSFYKDKEDAILYFGALQNKVDYFITRNKKDFAKFSVSALPVLSPKEFLDKYKGQQ
jgi:predicted nucleic acid-binding protein